MGHAVHASRRAQRDLPRLVLFAAARGGRACAFLLRVPYQRSFGMLNWFPKSGVIASVLFLAAALLSPSMA